jgi:hypothetical protein
MSFEEELEYVKGRRNDALNRGSSTRQKVSRAGERMCGGRNCCDQEGKEKGDIEEIEEEKSGKEEIVRMRERRKGSWRN